MVESLQGKVAIVTGGSRGIGRAIARILLEHGATVAITGVHHERLRGAEHDLAAIAGARQRVLAFETDVRDSHSVRSLVDETARRAGGLDILVNNAGILRDKSFHNMTPDLWSAVIDVHLNGAYHVTSAAWPHMRANSYGRVVSTASGAGIFGNFGQANYGAAKMGLVGFTRVLAQEGAKYNIKANAIAPVARTRMTEDILGGFGDRLEAHFVSPLVTYLCHESCDATGRIFSVAGGRVAEVFIAEGPGYTDPQLTPESIAANWDAVTDRSSYDVPTSMNDEIAVYLKHLS
jgi:NAD(P)-dependent dehydrogenase (short-subunit alcohol dehydrogenase family)